MTQTYFQIEGRESNGAATAVVLSLLALIHVVIFAVAVIAIVGHGILGIGAASVQSGDD